MKNRRQPIDKPSVQTLQPVFLHYFNGDEIETKPGGGKRKPYQRVWTARMTLWGMVNQRLAPGQSCSGVVGLFKEGAADGWDPMDRHPVVLSKRMKSEHNAGYVQARERLSIPMIRIKREEIQRTVAVAQAESEGWHGHAVRLMDGTTFRLLPRGDLVATYGQATNQKGTSDWVTVKSVASFCLDSRTVVAHAEGVGTASEAHLLGDVMRADPQRDSVYVGDLGYGHYRVVQIARACQQHVVVRLRPQIALKLLRAAGMRGQPANGWDCPWTWEHAVGIASEPGVPTTGIPGRLLYARVTRPGFRPVDLFLFTTLTDSALYPLADIVALYGRRWDVELRYRDVKTTLDMEEFDVRSAAMFQRELEVGLLTYNLICALMTQAARTAQLPVHRLSFTDCMTRIRDVLQLGVPVWVTQEYAHPLDWLIERLAKCRLPVRRRKVSHEPRVVRRRPQVFHTLTGSRAAARQKYFDQIAAQVDQVMNS
jgi:hypothetical protein